MLAINLTFFGIFQPSVPFAQFHSGYDLDSWTRLKHYLGTRLERAGLPSSHQTPKQDFNFLSFQAGTSAYTMVTYGIRHYVHLRSTSTLQVFGFTQHSSIIASFNKTHSTWPICNYTVAHCAHLFLLRSTGNTLTRSDAQIWCIPLQGQLNHIALRDMFEGHCFHLASDHHDHI